MAFALSLALPAIALGAGKAVVTTGGVAKVTPASVTLLGKVNPNAAATSYFFQIGPTVLYGAQTKSTAAGSGTQAINVVADVPGSRQRRSTTTGSSPRTASASPEAPIAR